MRILIITNLYPDESPIPKTNAVHDLVRYWTDEHEVVCFKETGLGFHSRSQQIRPTGKDWKYEWNLLFGHNYCEIDKVKVYGFARFPNPFGKCGIRKINELCVGGMVRRMKQTLAKIQFVPDVVIVHFPMPNIINYIGRLGLECPKIAVMHRGDADRLETSVVGEQLSEQRTDMVNREFDAVFARSPVIYDRLNGMGKLHKLKDCIISSGVPKCKNPHKRSWENWKTRDKVILYAGRLDPLKGPTTILKSLTKLKADNRIQYQIVGEGKEEENIRRLCQQLGLEEAVKMAGAVPREEVYDYMEQADIFAMPSRPETFGLAYLEAMINGCIAIGSKNEGIDGIIVNGKNGFLVNALDEDDLAQCFQRIFDLDEEEIQAVSDNARQTAEQYTQEERADIYLKQVLAVVEQCNGKS